MWKLLLVILIWLAVPQLHADHQELQSSFCEPTDCTDEKFDVSTAVVWTDIFGECHSYNPPPIHSGWPDVGFGVYVYQCSSTFDLLAEGGWNYGADYVRVIGIIWEHGTFNSHWTGNQLMYCNGNTNENIPPDESC